MMQSFQVRQAKFEEWHKNNPIIWKYFERFSLEAVYAGHTKISHWLIINRIRWEVYVITTGVDFKISNDFIAFYARLWRKHYPQYKNLFNIKKMVGEPWQEELI
jgi:hypothetical protein